VRRDTARGTGGHSDAERPRPQTRRRRSRLLVMSPVSRSRRTSLPRGPAARCCSAFATAHSTIFGRQPPDHAPQESAVQHPQATAFEIPTATTSASHMTLAKQGQDADWRGCGAADASVLLAEIPLGVPSTSRGGKRRGPRRVKPVQRFSRPPQSTTLPPLQGNPRRSGALRSSHVGRVKAAEITDGPSRFACGAVRRFRRPRA
jgi:hypothetical protein